MTRAPGGGGSGATSGTHPGDDVGDALAARGATDVLSGSGAWYSCLTADLDALRAAARRACHQHATMPPDDRGACAPLLAALLGTCPPTAWIEAPFHCAYGLNLHLADGVYLNSGCVVLDTAPVHIGAGTMFGPGVHVYCADHHRDPVQRRNGMERGLPVRIGADVWIGGGAIVLPGVTIGDGAIVGAGAVVSRDVARGIRVAGVPAHPLPDRG